MSLWGSTSKWCVALGVGSTGFGGGKAWATTGGSLGVGWNSEQPPKALKQRPKATVLRDTAMSRVVTPSFLQQSRAVRQLIARIRRLGAVLRKMTRQQVADRVDAGNRPGFKAAGTEVFLHEAAYGRPLRLTDPALKAAVGDDFDMAIRQLDVDQHTVVRFGIPNAQSGKHFQGMIVRGHIVQEVFRCERRFDGE